MKIIETLVISLLSVYNTDIERIEISEMDARIALLHPEAESRISIFDIPNMTHSQLYSIVQDCTHYCFTDNTIILL